MKIRKYFVYKDATIDSDVEMETFDREEAIQFARDNDLHFVEEMYWNDVDDYENREPADGWKTVYKM